MARSNPEPREPASALFDALWREFVSRMRPLSVNHQPNGPRLALWRRGRRSGTRTCCTHRFAGRVMVAPTGARDAQAEGLEVFFAAQAHRGVADLSLRINLPPFAILAQTPIRRCHNRLPFPVNFSRSAIRSRFLPSCNVLWTPLLCNVCAPHMARRRRMHGSALPQPPGRMALEGGMRGEEPEKAWRWGYFYQNEQSTRKGLSI